jgi:tetratricopeptide (TPR) repeat protein
MCPTRSVSRRVGSWLSFPAAVLLLVVSPGRADVIYLNNGSVMIVEKAWEDGGEIKYQTPQGIQSLPKSSVRRIQEEKSTPPPSTRKWESIRGSGSPPAKSASDIAIPSGPGSTSVSTEALDRLRENLKADPADTQAKSELIHALNSIASLQLAQGDFPAAKNSLGEALALDKRNPVILSNLAITNLRLGDYRASEDLLLACLEIDKNQRTYYLLGRAYYAQEKISEAISQWTAALELGPDKEISQQLEKARLEAGAHNEQGALQSAHFILRFDRKVSDYGLGQQILTTLEGLYRQLSRELTSQSPGTVAVILYPDHTFFDITRAPSWTGALFDGKIRVPTKGLSGVTPELTATLTHELTHSVIASLPGRGCPAWFNEGLAQLQEGKSASGQQKQLAQLQKENQLVPLKSLRGSFVGLSAGAAALAYTEGLSAVEYLVARFGRAAIRNILDLMAQNYNFENAFRTALRQSAADFESAWQQSLAP